MIFCEFFPQLSDGQGKGKIAVTGLSVLTFPSIPGKLSQPLWGFIWSSWTERKE